MTVFALDTDTLSYLLKDDDVFSALQSEIQDGNDCIIPPVAYYEIRRGLLHVNATAKLRHFDRMCRDFGIGEMSTAAWDEAARLYIAQRRCGRAVEDADLLLAAFCIVGGHTLVTNNARHFEAMSGLSHTNWK